jgi:hypothetical protein
MCAILNQIAHHLKETKGILLFYPTKLIATATGKYYTGKQFEMWEIGE